MRKLIVLCAISVVIMHFNQDLSAKYWIGFIGVTITSLLIGKRLDNERTERNNR